MRDLIALEEVSRILINLPVLAARQTGVYYRALALKRKGDPNEARMLLETVAGGESVAYRARAIQALGANHFDRGLLDQALEFQLEALRAASDKHAHDWQTMLMAQLEISHVKSDTGDHKGALVILENVSPLVHTVARLQPFYFYLYHNELAIELGEVGHVAEAQAALHVALSSPYAPAYPEWAETRRELEAKRKSATSSKVAINRSTEAQRARQRKPQRKPTSPKSLAFSSSASRTQPFQTAATSFPRKKQISARRISLVDRVLICAGPRAPPLPL